jgi:hypothetical protein
MKNERLSEFVYHGSKYTGLKEIKRRVSSHGNNWVYATKSKAVATIFINDKGSDLTYYLGGNDTKESPIILVERKRGFFDKIFNLSGSIYTLNASNFKTNQTAWKAEVVSMKDEIVINEEKIENINKELDRLNDLGMLKLFRYPNRPSNIPLDNSDLIMKMLKLYQKGQSVQMFFELYPELIEQFNKILIEQEELTNEQVKFSKN